MAQTRPDARQKRFPANAVVCLYHAELSTTYDTAVKKQVGLISRLRESDLGPQSPGAAAASFPSRASEHFGRSNTRVWRGFRHLPRSSGTEPQRVRFRRREPLLRCPAEEWENSIHLRSAPVRNLRPRSVPPLRLPAVLVPEPSSRPANRYLTWSRRPGCCRGGLSPTPPAQSKLPMDSTPAARAHPGTLLQSDRMWPSPRRQGTS